jgi:hypothetical protein
MTIANFDALLDQILGLAEGGGATSRELAVARARLAEAMDRAREHAMPVEPESFGRSASAAEIVAYAGKALGPEDRRRFEAEMAASPAMFLDVRDALEFLDDVESRIETAPSDLD